MEPLLRPWDLGSWTGRALGELDLAAWRDDPAYDDHGGESLLALVGRVGRLLHDLRDDLRAQRGRLVAVTHAAVIKAAVALALDAPATAGWKIDVRPGSVTELHPAADGWRVVQVNAPLGS